MTSERRSKTLTAVLMITPFVITYLTVFAYPVYKMFALSFTNAPLVGEGEWVGFDNYLKLLNQKLFFTSVWNTGYFVVLTVIPNTLIGLGLALMVVRLKGWLQSLILVLFFLPYILPVSVVTQIWEWVLDQQFGMRNMSSNSSPAGASVSFATPYGQCPWWPSSQSGGPTGSIFCFS